MQWLTTLGLAGQLLLPADTATSPIKLPTAAVSVQTLITMLEAQGGNPLRSARVAEAVYIFSTRHGVDPVLVVGIIGVENNVLLPTARSRAGALGIMQVMPLWLHTFKSCGRNLRNIETNICFGTRIFALNLIQSATVERALLRYNGCTHAHCEQYAARVIQRAQRAERAVSPMTITELEQ